MGEYADDFFRQDVKQKFGFDPGSMYEESNRTEKSNKAKSQKLQCGICKKWFVGIQQHQLAVHKKLAINGAD